MPFPFDLLVQLSLLALLPIPSKARLAKFPGALRLRWFRQNEPICRQGEEDCSAFYILKWEDMETLRSYPQRRTPLVVAEIAEAEKKIKDLEAVAQKAQVMKEREKISKQITGWQEKFAELKRELEQLPALSQIVEKLPAPPQSALDIRKAGDHANQQLEQQAGQAQDKQKAAFFRELCMADADRKRAIAGQLERDDPALAKLLRASAEAADVRKAAVVRLGGAPAQLESETWLQFLKRKWTGVNAPTTDRPTISIPFDGPTEISLRSRQAILNEGDLFGEMACLYRAPRSATVVAACDCYVLEMLSNILAEIDKEPSYQKERDRIYKERALDMQLRDLSIFRDLTDAEFARVYVEIRSQFELVRFKTGELVCDEHEHSDCVYLIRSGLVQVKKNVSSLLTVADVLSWRDLWTTLRGAGPVAAVYGLLPEHTHTILAKTQDLDQLSFDDRSALVHGLNEVIKNRHLPELPDLQGLPKSESLRERVRSARSFKTSRVADPKLAEVIKTASLRESKELASDKLQEWSELDHRRLNRLLLEEILPNCLRRLPQATGPDAILTYCSRGDFIGEIGVCKRQPRSSTCIAFGRPRSDVVQVELVRMGV